MERNNFVGVTRKATLKQDYEELICFRKCSKDYGTWKKPKKKKRKKRRVKICI